MTGPGLGGRQLTVRQPNGESLTVTEPVLSVEIQVPVPQVSILLSWNGVPRAPTEVLAELIVERDYWKARAERFETELADHLQRQQARRRRRP